MHTTERNRAVTARGMQIGPQLSVVTEWHRNFYRKRLCSLSVRQAAKDKNPPVSRPAPAQGSDITIFSGVMGSSLCQTPVAR